MLNHFDTVFAFVAIMTGVSLVVTSLTQMIGALFAFRGRHLQWGIGSLLENYLPEIKGLGDAVSRHLLHHPLVSDSMFSETRWHPAGGLAGGVQFLWRGWKYATVVRSEELVAIVKNLAGNMDRLEPMAERAMTALRANRPNPETLALLLAEVEKVKGTEGLASHWSRRAESYLEGIKPAGKLASLSAEEQARWVTELGTFFRAIAGVAKLAKRLEFPKVVPKVPGSDNFLVAGLVAAGTPGVTGGPTATVAGARVASTGGASTPADPVLGREWDRWFDATMHRVSERFATNMRIWTVVFSIGIAFGGGVDASRLFDRLSSDPEYRALIISGVDGVLKQAEALPASARKDTPDDDAAPWARIEADVAELEAMIRRQSELDIFRPGSPLADGWKGFLGRVLSAMLLSLGAPFWFNALKKMANLRPALANKVEGGK